MPKLVIFGTGKSSSYLIKKLQDKSEQLQLKITLVDPNIDYIPKDCKNHSSTTYISDSIKNTKLTNRLIKEQDLVISMLPPSLHIEVAKLCLTYRKNLLTASYVSAKMGALHNEASQKGLLFLNEMGVDPGLDHMSAMKIINSLKEKGATIKSFNSHTGGLLHIQKPTDLWNYKFTWNPKNVITAGSNGAIFLQNGIAKKIAYSSLFTKTKPLNINGINYDSYANRNSLNYIEKYSLQGIKNLYRGTLRYSGYCKAWNVFVQLGMTDDVKPLHFESTNSRESFLRHFLSKNSSKTTTELFCDIFKCAINDPIYKKLNSLSFFDNKKQLTKTKGTAAAILQAVLEEAWQLQKDEVDTLIMLHEIEYELNGKHYKTNSQLQIIGKDQYYTAMAKTVGLPMFEAALLMLQNKIKLTGVQIPTLPEIYTPVLDNLKNEGLNFVDKTILIS